MKGKGKKFSKWVNEITDEDDGVFGDKHPAGLHPIKMLLWKVLQTKYFELIDAVEGHDTLHRSFGELEI